jgi:hypothetical protein
MWNVVSCKLFSNQNVQLLKSNKVCVCVCARACVCRCLTVVRNVANVCCVCSLLSCVLVIIVGQGSVDVLASETLKLVVVVESGVALASFLAHILLRVFVRLLTV